MNRKEYMKKVYPKYWTTAVKKYGFSDLDKKLCNLIERKAPKGRILDVGVGTGYPFASYFSSQGYDVYGIDIAEDLIKECNTNFPKVKASVGDAENLKFPENHFSAVYCFRTTWYFTDILKVINAMIRVTKKGGYIFFDIMNADSKEIKIAHLRAKTVGRFIRIASNVIKVVKGKKVDWTLHYPETPVSPFYLNKYFMENQIDYLFGSLDNFTFNKANKEAVTKKKLVYIIKK
jgi:ubiquinone/menaquinone biosynthesis C-methylase UbiE